MWSRNSCWYVGAFVVGLILSVMLLGLRMPQGSKTDASEPAASTPERETGVKTPETAAKEPAGQTISDVDLQSLEVLRALRDSWAMKGSKIVKNSKREKVL